MNERSTLEDHVLRTDLTDHRGTDDARLVRAVADGDAIALAEAYHRTITAAHACARRMLASPVEIEALMRAVYSELWEDPPVDEALEGWVRARCYTLGTGYLRQRGLRAHSPSLAAWTSGLDADAHAGGIDGLERMIAELTDQQQAALVRAHDQGIRTADQEDPQAGPALQHALLVLASPLTDDERHAAEMCSSGVALSNWIFGLLPPHEAAAVPGTAAEPTPCGRLAGVLRRARRRFEPLPPTPDLGHRVLASVLGSSGRRESQEMRASRLDSDLRIASADLDRGPGAGGVPRSSLDMAVPAPSPASADSDDQPVTALRRRNGAPPRGWEVADDTEDEPAPLRAQAGPPALAGTSAPPVALGNTAPALASAPPAPDDEASDELVRMPLPQPRSGPRSPQAGDRAPDAGDDTQSIPAMAGGDRDDDAPPPPRALRARTDAPDVDREWDRRSEQVPAPSPLRGDDAPTFSPLRDDDRRGSRVGRDDDTESPLRRPAPAGKERAAGSPLSAPTQHSGHGSRDDAEAPVLPSALDSPLRAERRPQPPTTRTPGSPPQRDEAEQDAGPRFEARSYQRQPVADRDLDATAPTVQRDDSDPRLEDVFGRDPDATAPPSGGRSPRRGHTEGATALTAPPASATRRPADRPPPASERPTPRPQPASAGGPTVSTVDDETSGGSSLLRWLVVLLLVAAGAAVGIFLGQMLI